MDVKRILVFNVNWLGDVLFSTAAIRNLRRNYPDCFIACCIPSRCYPILKGNPNLNEIIIFTEILLLLPKWTNALLLVLDFLLLSFFPPEECE